MPIIFLIMTLFFSNIAFADIGLPPERSLGSENAPIKVIEYASMTCPHCAKFHKNTFGLIKKNYIDTGKVHFVFRDFPFDERALKAATLARCSDEEKFFPVLKVIFEQQNDWAFKANWEEELAKIMSLSGMSAEKLQACLAKEELPQAIVYGRLHGHKQYEVDSTPTFIINGKKYAGSRPYEEFKKIFDAILKEEQENLKND